jgi:hypothetical protein
MGGGGSKAPATEEKPTTKEQREQNFQDIEAKAAPTDSDGTGSGKQVGSEGDEIAVVPGDCGDIAENERSNVQAVADEAMEILEGAETTLVLRKTASVGDDFNDQGESIVNSKPIDWNQYENYSEPDAAIILQCFARQLKARKVLAQTIQWHNRLALDLYAERQAAKYSSFYQHVFYNLIRSLTLATHGDENDAQVDMLVLAAIASRDGEGKLKTKAEETGVFRDNEERDCYFQPTGLATTEHCKEVFSAFDKGQRLHIDSAIAIVEAFISQTSEQESIVEVAANDRPEHTVAVVIGDLFGHYSDFREILEHNGIPSLQKPYIFNGNFINHGAQNLECFFSILMLSLAFPGSVIVNRGNMEHAAFALIFGFVEDVFTCFSPWKCSSKLPKLLRLVDECFKTMVLGVQLFQSGLVVNGGVWRDEEVTLDYIKTIPRVDNKNVGLRHMDMVANLQRTDLMAATKEKRDAVLMQDILWSNVSHDVDCVTFNEKRGIGTCYGLNHVKSVLRMNRLNLMCSSGMPLKAGYSLLQDQESGDMTVARVFSASAYFGKASNSGGYLLVEPNMQVHACSFQTTHGKRDSHYNYIVQIKGVIRENIMAIEGGFVVADLSNNIKGTVSTLVWAQIISEKTGLDTPWLLDKGDILPWNTVSNDERDCEVVNYKQFVKHYGLTETTEERKRAQGTIFKYARPLWQYFKEHQAAGEKLSKDIWMDVCKVMSHHVHDPTLKEEAVTATMLSLLVQEYGLKEKGPEKTLQSIVTGAFWKDELSHSRLSLSRSLPMSKTNSVRNGQKTKTSSISPNEERMEFIRQGGIDRSNILHNKHGSDEPNSSNPELWNIENTEIDRFAKYETGSHQWALQSKLVLCADNGKDIPGYPINSRALASGYAHVEKDVIELRSRWKGGTE